MSSVRLSGVTKSFPGRKGSEVQVLKGIDVHVRSGEFLAILGASGCGKSTLLRLISGLELVTDGAIELDEEDVTALSPEKRELAMVFQNYALFPHLSVKENILFGLKSRRTDKQTQKQRLTETSELLGLESLLDRKPAELSGGQRQRVALGRALVSGQKLILMDEPLSNLDAKLRAEMRTEIKRIQRQLDLTIIYVTHDQVEAMTMADRVMMLSEGVIEQLAEPEELYRAPATTTVGRFIGSPPMNILQFTAESELAALAPEELSISGGSFGVRPERVVLDQAGQEPQTGQMLLGEATVLVNELLGADRIMTSTLRTAGAKDGPGQRIVARIAPDQQVQVDDTVLVSTAADAVHWYHPETGRRVENTRTPGLTPA